MGVFNPLQSEFVTNLPPLLRMGWEGGTIAASSVAPETIMKLNHSFQRGDLAEAKRIQFRILEIIKTMFAAGNFPEGFREDAALRGFDIGRARQPLSERQQTHLEEI